MNLLLILFIAIFLNLNVTTAEEEVKGFDLSGTYYSIKNKHAVSSGQYLMAPYQQVIEASLSEVDRTFDVVEHEIENSQRIDLIEIIAISAIYILLTIIALAIKHLFNKNSQIEKANLSMMPMLKTQAERANMKNLLSMLQPHNTDTENRFIEI